jgi:hypothetical protein
VIFNILLKMYEAYQWPMQWIDARIWLDIGNKLILYIHEGNSPVRVPLQVPIPGSDLADPLNPRSQAVGLLFQSFLSIFIFTIMSM